MHAIRMHFPSPTNLVSYETSNIHVTDTEKKNIYAWHLAYFLMLIMLFNHEIQFYEFSTGNLLTRNKRLRQVV